MARSCKTKIPSIGNELGLGWYDYGARMLNPAIGRWNGVDAHAENYFSWSPYNYVGDNPIIGIDPNGKDWVITRDPNDENVINITVNAAILNSSGKDISMVSFMNVITSEVQSLFSGSDELSGMSFNMTMNLREVSSVDDLTETEHLYDIRPGDDFEEGVAGFAATGGLNMALNADYINSDGTWVNGTGGTAAHELGHTGGLMHPHEFGQLPSGDPQGFNPDEPTEMRNFMEWRDEVIDRINRSSLIVGSGSQRDIYEFAGKRTGANIGQILSVEQKLKNGELNRQNNYVVRPFPVPTGSSYKRVLQKPQSPKKD